MKKKIISILIAVFASCTLAFSLTACSGKHTLTGTEISSEVFEVNGDNLFTKVSNSQASFNFNNSIKLADGATFGVFTDISCREIDRIQSYMVSNLSLGNNTYYFLVSNQNSTPKVYTVTVRRRLNYTVTFKTGEGALIEIQTVEEDGFAKEPQSVTTKLGCNTWNYDFNNPITQNTTITATYEAKEEMANFNFTSTETTCEITGVKDKTVTNIIVPNYVTSISDGAFYNYILLENIEVDSNNENYKSIDGNLYSKDGKTLIQYAIGKTATSFNIPNSVTSIGDYAFCGCYSLISINIPSNVTSIGEDTFYGCNRLVEVVNKSSINIVAGSDAYGYLGYYALEVFNSTDTYANNFNNKNGFITHNNAQNKLLAYVGKATKVNIPNNITEINVCAFYGCTSLQSVVIGDSVESIGVAAFYRCTTLESIEIPNSVTNIGNSAFYGCTSLQSIEIPNSVISIGEGTFGYCSSLKNASIGDSVTSIGQVNFIGCVSLESVTIGSGVTSIGSYAFMNCFKLAEVINKSSHITIKKGSSDNGYVGCYALDVYNSGDTFTGTKLSNDNGYIIHTNGAEKTLVGYSGNLTKLTIPNYVTKINDYAFAACTSLQSVTIPNSVTSIGEDAFNSCVSLQNITIPNSVTSIGNYAFNGCVSLQSVTIGGSVTSVGNYAFYNCTSLQSVTIENGATSIGSGMFDGCTSLQSVIIPNSVTSIGYQAFYNCNSLQSVTIGNGVTSIGNSAFDGCSLSAFNIKDSIKYLGNIDNPYLYLIAPVDANIVTANIDNGCKLISSHAFSHCNSLQSVTIGNGVTSIGDGAFYDCSSLTSVVIGNSVTSIGNLAFGSCVLLERVEMSNSLISIGSNAFAYCRALQSIEIPSSVTYISAYAFYRCNALTSITFNDTSTWYRTDNYQNWQNKTGGTQTSVTSPTTNDDYFKSTYDDYYWYKN